jgi:uracil-DNA glycosylase
LNSKKIAYKDLVEKRKNFKYPEGLMNPSEVEGGIYDREDQMGPWSKWHSNLDAKIVVIGKDWGDVKTYIKQKGNELDNDRTNQNLRELFRVIGIEIGSPNKPALDAPVFFTNAVLGLRVEGGKSGPLKGSWVKQDSENFLKPTIDLVQPDILITLGKDAYDALVPIYHLKKETLKNLVDKNPLELKNGKLLFAMYHCGQYATSRSRNLKLQKEDWKKIENYHNFD